MDDAVLATIRSWVGSSPTIGDLELRLDRLGDPNLVALEVLRSRRADLVSNPMQFTVVGDYSENRTANLKAISDDILQLEKLTGTGADVVTAGVLVRATSGRRIRTRTTGW